MVRARVRHLQLKRNGLGELWALLTIHEDGVSQTVLVFARTYASLSWEGLVEGALCDILVEVRFGQDGKPKMRLDCWSLITGS